MIAFGLFFILAQAKPSAVPVIGTPPPAVTSLLTGWTTTPAMADKASGEYAHYIRRESDASDSILTATRQVCDCQVKPLVDELRSAIAEVSQGTAIATHSTLTVCGHPAERVVLTNVATPGNTRRNLDVTAFRDGPALIILTYTFRYAAPMADAESAATALCPQLPT